MTGIAGRIGARARRLQGQVLSAADRYASVAVGIAAVRRDIEVAGTLLAGALAFRIFIWLLPCCLLLVGLAGFSVTSAQSPEELTRDLGMSPLIANMLGQVGAQAAQGRWVTAIVGVLLLVVAANLAAPIFVATTGRHRRWSRCRRWRSTSSSASSC